MADIPGKLPMSEVISGAISQNEYNNEPESINEYESIHSKGQNRNSAKKSS